MNPSPSPTVYPSSSITILLIALLIAAFFLGFFLICLCRFLTQNLFGTLNSPTVNLMVVNSSNGLDPSLVQSFPTFEYSTVKEIRQDTKFSLECAICLSEFEDHSMLRLLTVCYHVFHKECVDLWLESHKTCPVCRGDLDLPPEKLVSPQLGHGIGSPMSSIREVSYEDAVSINIEDDEREDVSDDDDDDEEESEESRGQSTGCARTMSRKQNEVDRLPRSNSTGHSIVRGRNELMKGYEKYTLRLSDQVKFKIVRGHTGSCITFGEFSDNRTSSNGRFAEVSGSADNYGESSKS